MFELLQFGEVNKNRNIFYNLPLTATHPYGKYGWEYDLRVLHGFNIIWSPTINYSHLVLVLKL